MLLLFPTSSWAVVTLGAGGGTYNYNVVDGEDVNVTAVGWTLNNVTLYGGKFDIDAAVTMNNCLAIDGANNVLDIAVGITATVNNCCFKSSKAAAEAAGGTATDTSCLWETDPLMIDPANNKFGLKWTSPCVKSGTDVSLTQDYRGRNFSGTPNIGAYQSRRVFDPWSPFLSIWAP
jgi:hypothetical protein